MRRGEGGRRGRKRASLTENQFPFPPVLPSLPSPPSSLDNPLIWRRGGDRSPLGRSALCRGPESWLIGAPFFPGTKKIQFGKWDGSRPECNASFHIAFLCCMLPLLVGLDRDYIWRPNFGPDLSKDESGGERTPARHVHLILNV